jgi:hypothetical protein
MSDESAKEWLNTNWPNMRACDVNWTMKRYAYPDHVCEHIKTNWVKINDENGGVYHEPEYSKHGVDRHINKKEPNLKEGQTFAKNYKKTEFADMMDEPNKKALDVMANEGMDAAVKHMFTDQESGRQLSYAEMRSRYG